MVELVNGLLEIVKVVGWPAALAFAVGYLGYKRVWVWGFDYNVLAKELESKNKELAKWQQLAIRGTNLTQQAVQEVLAA